MKKALKFLDKILGFSMIKKGANEIISDVLPSAIKTAKLALNKEGRMQLALEQQKAKEEHANNSCLRAIDEWFPRTFAGITVLIIGYPPLYFFLLKNNAVRPFDFIWGFAIVLMMCVSGLIALPAVPLIRSAIRYRSTYKDLGSN